MGKWLRARGAVAPGSPGCVRGAERGAWSVALAGLSSLAGLLHVLASQGCRPAALRILPGHSSGYTAGGTAGIMKDRGRSCCSSFPSQKASSFLEAIWSGVLSQPVRCLRVRPQKCTGACGLHNLEKGGVNVQDARCPEGQESLLRVITPASGPVGL